MALKGTNGDDFFRATIFADEIFGFAGNDVIQGSPGADTIDGGADRDTVDYAYFSPLIGPLIKGDAVNVDLERSVQSGGLADGDVLIGIEIINGSEEDDTIRGDSANNELFGNGGDDFIEGRAGNDIIQGDASLSFLLGQSGNDHLDGGTGDDQIFGNQGNDTLIGGLDNDQLFGQDGNDTLFGDQGFDRLDGGAGVDTATYVASASAVTVFLNAGIGAGGDAAGDVLVSIENVTGSLFGDSLFGSAVANVLNGGNGNDTLAGLGGADTLNGGNGNDTATYAASAAGVTVDLTLGTGTGGDAAGDTLIAIENLTGSSFADVLTGSAVANILNGGGGADTLIGAGGLDTLTGGGGADTFVWRDITDSGITIPTADTIVDFDPLAGDRIDLSGVDANVFAAGNQAFTFIGAAGFSGTPGEINFVHVNGDTIIQLQTGVSGDVEMALRIQGIITPDAGMFVL